MGIVKAEIRQLEWEKCLMGDKMKFNLDSSEVLQGCWIRISSLNRQNKMRKNSKFRIMYWVC